MRKLKHPDKFPFKVGEIITTDDPNLRPFVGRRVRVIGTLTCFAKEEDCWKTCRYRHTKMRFVTLDLTGGRDSLCVGIGKLRWRKVEWYEKSRPC